MTVLRAISDIFLDLFWDFTRAPYSYDHYKMMSNLLNREAYLQSFYKLRSGSKSETFLLENGEQVTIHRTW